MTSSTSLGTASLLLKDRLSALVTPGHVRLAEPEDSVAGMPAQWVVAPGSEEEVAAVLRLANEAELAVIPRGGGTKLGWGNPPRHAEIILSLARLNHVVEHAWADLTVTVEAGTTVAELARTLAQHGQRLAVDPLWPEQATVGGVLSTNDTGALFLSHCGLRDLIIGVTLALADGTLAKSGGKVVKNVAGYDLPKLATGALGTLGVITRAIFRVHPLPRGARALSLRLGSIEEVEPMMTRLLQSNLVYNALQICFRSDAPPAIDIGLEGSADGLSAQEIRVRQMCAPALVDSSSGSLWTARQNLWTPPAAAIAKLCVLPSLIAKTAADWTRLAEARKAAWRAVVQGTGIGWLRIEAAAEDAAAIFGELRATIEGEGGSLVVLRLPPGNSAPKIDAWGTAGDAFPLMTALKQQFDPKGILNPGRYVGGI